MLALLSFYFIALSLPSSFPPSLLSRSDDDIIFEDFARQRLIGAKDDKDEDEEPVDSPKCNDR